MGKTKWWQSMIACAIGIGVYGFAAGEARAGLTSVKLQGSGPVYTQAVKPGEGTVTVAISNGNNLNVGYDLIDLRTGGKIVNGTIKKQGSVEKLGTAHAGRTYKLRLRCQEPPWNHTKCRAEGIVSWY
jgi:hypothetical protein